MAIRIRKKDRVMVMAGKDRGKTGEVLRVIAGDRRVVVSKVNMVARHKKARGAAEPGGIHRMEAPISVSNVMLMCPKCEKPMRPRSDLLASGDKVRICRRCGETLL